MRAEAQPPRRRWPWVIGGALLVIAVVVVAIALLSGRAEAPVPTATTPGSTNTTEPSSDVAPTGCLGGPNRDAAMILAAQEEAAHTSAGAVEVAASFVRWIQRFPYPSRTEATQVGERILGDASFTDDLASYLEAEPDLSGGIVSPGQTYFMSTVPGVWHVESNTVDEVAVTIGSGFVVEGSLSPTLRSSITITLEWQDGAWKVIEADGTRTTQDLYAIGQPLVEGC
jgi:hypothetical protein